MIKCQICGVDRNRITYHHLKIHNINLNEYKEKYPNSPIITEESRNKYKSSTIKIYENTPKEEFKKRYVNRKYSEEDRQKQLDILEKGRKENDYKNPERNKKISIKRKEYFKNLPEGYVSNMFKTVVIPKYKERLGGEEAYQEEMRKRASKANKTAFNKGKEGIMNNFEKEMINIISSIGYEYIFQFEINNYYYDCYIPKLNLILEFDGDYWYPENIEACKNIREYKQYDRDRIKEKIAINNGYKIERVRQSRKQDIYKYLN